VDKAQGLLVSPRKTLLVVFSYLLPCSKSVHLSQHPFVYAELLKSGRGKGPFAISPAPVLKVYLFIHIHPSTLHHPHKHTLTLTHTHIYIYTYTHTKCGTGTCLSVIFPCSHADSSSCSQHCSHRWWTRRRALPPRKSLSCLSPLQGLACLEGCRTF
jgi:hypothetical protein